MHDSWVFRPLCSLRNGCASAQKPRYMAAAAMEHFGPQRRTHPAILLSLANEILVSNYELGPWMHTASEVRNFSFARDGELIRVQARIEDRFERKGHEFVVLD